MNYRVVWRQKLERSIGHAAFYAHEVSRDATALIRAARDIELRLSDDPAEVGESREGNERVFIVHPITVIFEVFENSKTVMIYDAVYHPRMKL